MPPTLAPIEGYSPHPLGPFFIFSSSFYSDLFFLFLSHPVLLASSSRVALIVPPPCHTPPLRHTLHFVMRRLRPRPVMPPSSHCLSHAPPLLHHTCRIKPLSRIASITLPVTYRTATL